MPDRHTARLQFLDAVIIAVDNRDRLFRAIEASPGRENARAAVMRESGLTTELAQAVLDLEVARFTQGWREDVAKDRDRLRDELNREH